MELTENGGHEIGGQDIYRLKIVAVAHRPQELHPAVGTRVETTHACLDSSFVYQVHFLFRPFDSETVGQPCHVVLRLRRNVLQRFDTGLKQPAEDGEAGIGRQRALS